MIKTYTLTNIALKNPGKAEYEVDDKEKTPAAAKEDGDNSGQDSSEDTLDVNNPDGGLINSLEKRSNNTFAYFYRHY